MSWLASKSTWISFLVVSIGLWMGPILRKLPAPDLPQIQLQALDGSILSTNSCHVIRKADQEDALKFCEDLVHWEQFDLIIASCDAGRLQWNTVMGPLLAPDPRGGLYLYQPNKVSQPPQSISRLDLDGFPVGKDFHPLGISEPYAIGPHSFRLFVVNHRRDRSVIEVFDISMSDQPESLVQLDWRRTLAHESIWTPNSIVVLGPTSLLVSNDHHTNRRLNPFLHTLETWLALPGGNVLLVDFDESINQESQSGQDEGLEQKGVRTRKLVDRISFANGIAISPDGSTFIVASSLTHAIHFYQIKRPTENKPNLNANGGGFELIYQGTFPLKFAPDNLSFTGPWQIIVAGHPHGLSLSKFTKDPKRAPLAGSWISLLEQNNQEEEIHPNLMGVHDLFKDDGKFFGTSSTAVIVSNSKDPQTPLKLFASGLYDRGLLECNL